jgi:hypothetical protein
LKLELSWRLLTSNNATNDVLFSSAAWTFEKTTWGFVEKFDRPNELD